MPTAKKIDATICFTPGLFRTVCARCSEDFLSSYGLLHPRDKHLCLDCLADYLPEWCVDLNRAADSIGNAIWAGEKSDKVVTGVLSFLAKTMQAINDEHFGGDVDA